MKEYARGRGYSKENRVSFDFEDGEDEAAFLEHIQHEQGVYGWRGLVEEARNFGRSYLESKGLPTERLPPEQGYLSAARQLETMGYGRDTLPNLAARMIEQAEQVEKMAANGDLDGLVLESFDLGKLFALWRVYEKTEAGGRAGGQQDKRRHWAELVALQVDCWEDIPSESHLEDGASGSIDVGDFWNVYRDGDRLICADIYNSDAPEKTLARSTFEKRYLRKE